MKSSFDVTIRVGEKRLGTLLGIITEDREFELQGVVPVADTPPKPEHRFRNGKRFKGISAIDLIIQTLQSKSLTTEGLEKIFEGRGFAPLSAKPALYRLRDEGRIRRDNFGHWSFVK